jgi:hypothetical protein
MTWQISEFCMDTVCLLVSHTHTTMWKCSHKYCRSKQFGNHGNYGQHAKHKHGGSQEYGYRVLENLEENGDLGDDGGDDGGGGDGGGILHEDEPCVPELTAAQREQATIHPMLLLLATLQLQNEDDPDEGCPDVLCDLKNGRTEIGPSTLQAAVTYLQEIWSENAAITQDAQDREFRSEVKDVQVVEEAAEDFNPYEPFKNYCDFIVYDFIVKYHMSSSQSTDLLGRLYSDKFGATPPTEFDAWPAMLRRVR